MAASVTLHLPLLSSSAAYRMRSVRRQLRNGHAHFPREGTAQIIRTAPDFMPDCFKSWRIGKVSLQNGYDSSHTFPREALLPVAR